MILSTDGARQLTIYAHRDETELSYHIQKLTQNR